MTVLRTLPNLLLQAQSEKHNCRDIKESIGRTAYERYWRVATLVHPRDTCGTIWVLGIRHDHFTEWVASTSIGIIKSMDKACKVWGSDDFHLFLTVIEPLGTILHKVRPSIIAPLLHTLDIPIIFSDPNQKSLFDVTPSTGEPIIKL